MSHRRGVTNPVPSPNWKGGTPMTKMERRQRDDLNRFRKLTVGQDRIWTLQRIAAVTEADAEFSETLNPAAQPLDIAGMRDDALFLNRLAWDLEVQHDAVHGRRASLDPQGPRP